MTHVGMSLSDYLRETRLCAAARMLENDLLPIRKVATNAGFGNLSYFYRRFTEKYGMSPKQFQKKER